MKKYFFVIFLTVVSLNSWSASPPWYYYQAVLKATIGADSCFRVSDVISPEASATRYQVKITGCSVEKSRALATLLTKSSATEILDVVVLLPNGNLAKPQSPANSQEVAKTITLALTGNPYFVTVHVSHSGGLGLSDLFIEFKPEVIQLWSDNISDFYGLSNFVAQSAFGTVLSDHLGNFRIAVTTSRL